MGLFDNLYGSGQQYGNLVDDPARQEAKRRALLAISAQLMQAGGPSRLPVSTGQAIGSALQAGQGASDEAYRSAVEAAMLRKRMEPQPKDRGRLVMVAGPDGKPVYKYEDEAAGQAPYLPQTGTQDNIGSYQPSNYTEESWAKFIKSGDPAVLKRYEKAPEPAKPQYTLVDVPQPDGTTVKTMIDLSQGPASPRTPIGAPQRAPAEVAREAESFKEKSQKQMSWNTYVAAKNGLTTAMDETPTGFFFGMSPAFTGDQQVAEGAVASMVPVLKQLFRSAGEGTFTDRDQADLLKMVPTRSDKPAARKRKLENIDNIIKAKLGIADDGWKIERE